MTPNEKKVVDKLIDEGGISVGSLSTSVVRSERFDSLFKVQSNK